MGTLMYGAHFHGSSSLHLKAGLLGGAVMEKGDAYILPDDLDALYRNESGRYHMLVFNHLKCAARKLARERARG